MRFEIEIPSFSQAIIVSLLMPEGLTNGAFHLNWKIGISEFPVVSFNWNIQVRGTSSTLTTKSKMAAKCIVTPHPKVALLGQTTLIIKYK